MGGNDVLLIVDYVGNACTSTDGGATWTHSTMGTTTVNTNSCLWTGSTFACWGNKQMYTSAKGVAWTATPQITAINVGAVARSPQGTFVTVTGMYASQTFLRSTDGLTWQPTSQAPSALSHPIARVLFGYVDPSAACPLPSGL